MPESVAGKAAVFGQPNVDTDVIMPKRFLKTLTREGLADGAFADLRFDEQGRERPEFVLNTDAYRDASIMVVGSNFGCGSSREHAVWGLMQLGIKAIIGTDFGGIFYDNARKNGLVLPIVEEDTRDALTACVTKPESAELYIDIKNRRIKSDNMDLGFRMDEATQQALIKGSNETLDTLQLAPLIKAFETKHLPEVSVSVIK